MSGFGDLGPLPAAPEGSHEARAIVRMVESLALMDPGTRGAALTLVNERFPAWTAIAADPTTWPKEGARVLLSEDDGDVVVGQLECVEDDGRDYWTTGDGYGLHRPLAWMPLPAPWKAGGL